MKRTVMMLVLLLALLCAGAETAVNLSCAFLLGEDGLPLTEMGLYSQITCLEAAGLYAAREQNGGKLRLLDQSGCSVTEETYDSAREQNGVLVLERDGLFALYSYDLTAITGFEYTRLIPAGEGFAAFRSSVYDDVRDVLYVLSADGTSTAASCSLQYADFVFSEGLAAAMSYESGLYGYMDTRGEWAIAPAYHSAGAFTDGLAAADGGVIDTRGAWVLESGHDSVSISESYVLCRKEGNLFLYLRRDGELRLRLQKNGAWGSLYGDYACIYTGAESLVYNEKGELTAGFKLDALLYPDDAVLLASTQSGMFLYDMDTGLSSSYCLNVQKLRYGNLYRYAMRNEEGTVRFGLMNARGKKLTPAVYEQINTPAAGLAAAEADGVITVFNYGEGELSVFSELILP